MTKRNMLAVLLVAGVLSVMGDSKHTSYAKEEMKVELHALETLPKNLTGQISRVCQSQYQAKREEVLEQIRLREEEARKAAEEAARQERISLEKLMASIIFCEAGNQSHEGQVAVGAVIMNRVRDGAFPDTVEEVIYQSGQFGPVATGWLDRVRSTDGYTEAAMQAAKDALAGANPIGNCLYFDQGGYGMQIGAHYFH